MKRMSLYSGFLACFRIISPPVGPYLPILWSVITAFTSSVPFFSLASNALPSLKVSVLKLGKCSLRIISGRVLIDSSSSAINILFLSVILSQLSPFSYFLKNISWPLVHPKKDNIQFRGLHVHPNLLHDIIHV